MSTSEQVVELNSKSMKLIEKLTKALGKAADKFNSPPNSVSQAFGSATSGAASLGAGIGGGPETGSGVGAQFQEFQEQMTAMILPMIQSFGESTRTNFEAITQRIMIMSQSFNQFATSSAVGLSAFIARTLSSLILIKQKKVALKGLAKNWKFLNKIIDTHGSAVKVVTFLMNAHQLAVTAYQLATGTATVATKKFIIQNRILNAVLRKNPIILLISILAGAAAAFMTFGNKVSGSNDELEEQNSLLEHRNDLLSKGKSIQTMASNFDNLDDRQLLALRDRNKQFIQSVEDQASISKNKHQFYLENLGFNKENLPTAAELKNRIDKINNAKEFKNQVEDYESKNMLSRMMSRDPRVERNRQQANSYSYDEHGRRVPNYNQYSFNSVEPGSEKAKRLKVVNSIGTHNLESMYKVVSELERNQNALNQYRATQDKINSTIKARDIKDPFETEDGLDLQQGSTEIAGGGKKMTNITINLDNMVETIAVHSEQLEEGLDEIETMVKEVFLRVLNSGNYAAQ